MASLMVIMEVPEHTYEELAKAMKEKLVMRNPVVDFTVPKHRGSRLNRVAVDARWLSAKEINGYFMFELIGVRP